LVDDEERENIHKNKHCTPILVIRERPDFGSKVVKFLEKLFLTIQKKDAKKFNKTTKTE